MSAVMNCASAASTIHVSMYSLVYQGVFLTDPLIHVCRRPDLPRECLILHFHEAEAFCKSLRPLEIIKERPVEVPLDGDALRNGTVHTGCRIRDELRAPCVGRVGDAVLRDVDGEVVLFEREETVVEGGGMHFPPHIRADC